MNDAAYFTVIQCSEALAFSCLGVWAHLSLTSLIDDP